MTNPSPIELFQSFKPAPLPEFGSCFTAFASTAFRLEMLPVYRVEGERVAFAAFTQGHANPEPQFNDDWNRILEAARSANKSISRLRMFSSDEPSHRTSYEKFEAAWAYPRNQELGEKIRFVGPQFIDELSRQLPLVMDFWLFDQREGFFMHYDASGQFMGVTRIPTRVIAAYQNFAENACASTPALR